MLRLLAQEMRLIFLSQLVDERGKACRLRLNKVRFMLMTEIKVIAQQLSVVRTLGQRNAVALEHGVVAPRKI